MSNRIAIIYPCKMGGGDDVSILNEYDPSGICDIFYWTSNRKKIDAKKVNKTDCTLDLESIFSKYKVIMPVDADVIKYTTGLSGGAQKLNSFVYQKGENIFIPTISPRKALILPLIAKTVRKAFSAAFEVVEALNNDKPISITTDKDYKILEHEDLIYKELLLCKEYLILDIETSALYPHEGSILGIAFGHKPHTGNYAPMEHWSKQCIELLGDLIKDPKVVTICHNITFEMKWLKHHLNILPHHWNNFHDTMIMLYCNDENLPVDLKTAAVRDTDLGAYEEELEQEKTLLCRKLKIKKADFTYDLLPFEILGPYACKDIDATAQVFKKYYFVLRKFKRIYTFLMQCCPAIARLELVGVYIDNAKLDQGILDFDKEIIQLENKLFADPAVKQFVRQEGKDFNPRSPKQVGKVLYDILGLPVLQLTDTGAASTARPIIEQFEDQVPMVKSLLEYRRAKKFRSTYLENIKNKKSKDGRLRTGFKHARTTSGRLASSGNLNFQSIPRDSIIKDMFVARPGYKIIQLDLGAAEVWVAAAESKDAFFIRAFASKLDFHGYIAKTAFSLDCEPNEVAELYKSKRQAAKAITFGILYGAQANKIATEIGCSKQEAQQLINQYFEKAPELEQWIKQTKNHITTHAWVKSAFGRTRRVPEVFSPVMGIKYHGINSAFNFVVQSVASDINLQAFSILTDRLMKEQKYETDVFIWNLVHDSIIAEVSENYLPRYINIVTEIFQELCRTLYPFMPTPIKLDFEVGNSWGTIEKECSITDWVTNT